MNAKKNTKSKVIQPISNQKAICIAKEISNLIRQNKLIPEKKFNKHGSIETQYRFKNLGQLTDIVVKGYYPEPFEDIDPSKYKVNVERTKIQQTISIKAKGIFIEPFDKMNKTKGLNLQAGFYIEEYNNDDKPLPK